MSWNPQDWGNRIISIVVVLITIGVAVGVGILIQGQFESIEFNIGNHTTRINIPAGFRIERHESMISLLVTLMIISGVIAIVFTVVIPTLQESIGGATRGRGGLGTYVTLVPRIG